VAEDVTDMDKEPKQPQTPFDLAQEHMRDNRLTRWVKNHWVTSTIVITIMTVLALNSFFGQSLSLVHVFERYVYPRPIEISNSDVAELTGTRFGHQIMYPIRWVRFLPMNGDGMVVQDPNRQGVTIRVYGSFFSGNPNSSVYDGNEETLEQFVQWREKETLHSTRVHRKEFKVTMSGLEKWMPPLEKMQVGYWWEESESDGTRRLEFVTKNNGVWHFLQCEAPRSLYPRYREFFFQVLNSFQVVVNESTDRIPALDEQEMRSSPNPP
jgi:hypothetical protein